ncbi:MAG: DUF5681 domain-containing protein [Pseudomonadota bacterium]
MEAPEPLAGRDAHGRFAPGRSGNPRGKKPGTVNRATALTVGKFLTQHAKLFGG